ncbi:bifunctional diaminohydroxyphosphoribosylaminopyrimidine deaminase/5-amino-6-(5-phosphoribosylamino)uracil reductase RibD [Sulfurimonas sp. HSL-3221]|uniref:bifunctional diaminohydroxyphosphoribosylaminopyrimidine deaminase/5-amino-6-(5-phosphoribosylamino)uracil reductase RibD n=1 Tax=Sulfurimonadaceae TaxID=2771471 RepID=UPI001E44C080|nr:bifunctional diaminohydroxyphosphoribosylaminopyrimidine deaminase/5-amino-6-(5-phosphoribosylamino)uracil reductase RibD [Sulfurimonas sp. HSL-3221]UFS61923.1 bifunctional diaminohydroxyphosphoribosylaminopyrimidine deaminase/5-amino-6-(5-phosphoribosylamino)uracil reductase RibD [Sulfurimonas sp. HSL-3221]
MVTRMARPDPMALAVDAAWAFQGCTFPNPAVGAAVTDASGRILSVAAHEKAGGPHAEVLALQQAFALLTSDTAILALTDSGTIHDYLLTHHNGCFVSCTIHVTLEPCAHHGKTPSCARLLVGVRMGRVVYAAADPNAEAAGGASILSEAGIRVEHQPSKASEDLLFPFVQWQKKPFVTFKWAQRLDGTIDGGTISGNESRRFVHAMRDAADLLVIGGNTVRTDHPTLDARMVEGKAPDILILSKRDDFDRTIPLFNVPGRKVMIASDLTAIDRYHNVLVEGGPGMFEAVQSQCDMYLCFVAPSSGGTIRFLQERKQFEIRHLSRSGEDVKQWMVNG